MCSLSFLVLWHGQSDVGLSRRPRTCDRLLGGLYAMPKASDLIGHDRSDLVSVTFSVLGMSILYHDLSLL